MLKVTAFGRDGLELSGDVLGKDAFETHWNAMSCIGDRRSWPGPIFGSKLARRRRFTFRLSNIRAWNCERANRTPDWA